MTFEGLDGLGGRLEDWWERSDSALNVTSSSLTDAGQTVARIERRGNG